MADCLSHSSTSCSLGATLCLIVHLTRRLSNSYLSLLVTLGPSLRRELDLLLTCQQMADRCIVHLQDECKLSLFVMETLFENGGVSGWRGHGPPPPRPPTSPTTGSLSRWSPRGIIAEAARGRTPHFDLVPSGIPPQSCLMAAPLRRGAHWRPLVQGADLFWPRLVA